MQFKNIPLPTDPEAEELTSLQVHYLNCIDVLSKEFAIFRKKAQTVLDTSDELFNERLDTDPVTLQTNLIKTMSIYHSVGQYVADAKTFQQIYDMLHYCAKKPKYSESDRKLYTGTKTLAQSNLLAQLKNSEEKIEKRITIIQSILKAETLRMQKEIN